MLTESLINSCLLSFGPKSLPTCYVLKDFSSCEGILLIFSLFFFFFSFCFFVWKENLMVLLIFKRNDKIVVFVYFFLLLPHLGSIRKLMFFCFLVFLRVWSIEVDEVFLKTFKMSTKFLLLSFIYSKYKYL